RRGRAARYLARSGGDRGLPGSARVVTPVLELHGVSVSYGKRRALEDVALTLAAGEIVALLGANGSGKSTTLRAISGLVRPSRGRVVYDGRDITTWPPDGIVTAGLVHVPEGREIFPEFTVLDNLLVGGHTAPSREVARRLERALATFPVLRERQRQPAGTLSGGEQQMLAIARALMAAPRAPAGRAITGAGPATDARDLSRDRADQRRRRHRAPRGAERAACVGRGHARLRAGDGPHRHDGAEPDACRRPARSRRLPRRVRDLGAPTWPPNPNLPSAFT